MVLAMTHEEVFAWLASRELRSYRDLPQIWYQIQLKFRDEPRPKGGVLRVREFVMKDSYSFDMDEAGLEVSYEKHIGAYDRIFSAAASSSTGWRATAASWAGLRRTSTWRRRPPARTAWPCATPAATPPTWSWRGRWPRTPERVPAGRRRGRRRAA